MNKQCYLNGEFVPLEEAKVGVYDMGLLRGFGIYEALTTFHRKPFRFDDHMERFRRSAVGLNIHIPLSDDEMRNVLATLIASNVQEGREAVVRIVLTGGEAIEGIMYNPEKPTLYVLVEELVPLPEESFSKGVSVTVYDFQRQFPESKTTNYIQAALLQEERKRAGALEILYTADGQVLECATSNFFIVKDGRILTPKEHILFGITRKVVLEVAKPHFPIEERAVSIKEMYEADEAFLTSSFKDVVPVIQVGGNRIGDGTVGKVTKKVMDVFRSYTESY